MAVNFSLKTPIILYILTNLARTDVQILNALSHYSDPASVTFDLEKPMSGQFFKSIFLRFGLQNRIPLKKVAMGSFC